MMPLHSTDGPPLPAALVCRRGRSCPDFSLGCGPIALFSGQTILDHRPRPGEPAGASMWDERKMPERWYELLRERMQVEEQRMRVIRNGDIIEHDDLEQLMAQVMRQAIAGAIEANTSAASLHACSAEWRAGLSRFSPSDFA